uniref:TROVE domain-containing protein n=1 Tax=Schistosoma mansoni TaxID=6183 RepID=A0A5K4F2R5_SCHMA
MPTITTLMLPDMNSDTFSTLAPLNYGEQQSLSGDPKLRGMPKALRKCMVSKFCEFDQNQLAQCKRRLNGVCSNKCKVSEKGAGDAVVGAVTDTLQSRLVDPSPIHFTLKKLVRKLHISNPALNVMCILGKSYPNDATTFSKMRLEGDWDASKAGVCMRLPFHSKWRVELTAGKSRDAWTKTITSGDLCHELILRNLKSILCSHISQTGHDIVLQRLSNVELVIEGKQLPFVYLTAYIAVEKLHDMLSMTANRKRLKALTKAMSLSARYNLSPIRCSVLVICSLCSGFELQKIRRSTRVKAIINVLSFIYGAICNAICENAVVYFVVDNDYNVASINRMLLLLYGSLWHTEENKKDTSLFRSTNLPLMDKIKLIYKNRKVSEKGAGDAVVGAVTDTLQSRLVDPSPIHFTLKKLVRKLHISNPALNVMCILGKSYPNDATTFSKMRLEGDWDASKAGVCMRLPFHSKWRVELTAGKSRDAWTKTITSGDLCHELILRNLKSILCSHISQTGHDIVLQRLSNVELVIEGKQLPFVYLTAYIAVEKLHDMLSMTANRKRLKDIRVEESNKIRSKYLYRSRKSRVRSLNISKELLNKYLLALTKAMSLSARYNLSPIRCSVLVICSLCSGFELQKIRRSTRVKAIINVLSFIYGAICNAICENAVVYFVVDNDYNVASINRMLLLLYGSLWHTEENKKDTSLFRSTNLPLMDKIKLIYKNRKSWEKYSLSLILDRFSAFRKELYHSFDKVIVFGDCPDSIAKYVVNYRANIGPIKAIWNNLSGNDKWCTSFPMTGWIESKGLVDSVFKYLSLPDDKCLVEQIDKIDETYQLNSMFDLPLQVNVSSEQQGYNKLSQMRSTQDNFCRVYISSSYMDMHAERDLIYHTLVPNLCQNVAQTCSTCIDLVDLRIGVPETITCSLMALEMYLKQAAASDIFVLLLGAKYGWVPDELLVRALPDSLLAEVNKFYKPGMSVTEMEYHMVKLAAVNKLSRTGFNMFPSRMFVFIRDFNTSDIPNEYGQIFRDHDPVNLHHLDAFKQLLLNDGVSILSYSAQFIGVIDDRPMVGNLDNFASQFLSTLESTLKRLYYNPVNDAFKLPMVTSSDDNDELINISEFFATYVNPIACDISPRHLLNIQHAFKTMTGQCVPIYFTGQHIKSDESSSTTSKKKRIEDRTSNYQNKSGGILVITGSPGSGKTVHLAALAMSLAKSDHQSTLMSSEDCTRSTSTTRKSISNSQSLAKYQILIHFTSGIPSTGLPSCKQLSKVLDHWIKCLAAQLQNLFSSSNILKMFLSRIKVNLDSANTANDHHNLKLKMLCFNKMIWFLGYIPELNYAFLIDDVDHLDPLILDDWLPSVLPKNVQFIFTCESNSKIIQKLTCQYDNKTCSVYQIPQLTSEECRSVILSHLQSNGVSCVPSQLEYEIAVLISACESNNPSYFYMVCKYLQLCGTHDEVKSHLKMLSGTIDQLIDQIIKNLEGEYKNDLIIATLAFLIFYRHSLSSKELLILLNEWLIITQNINEKSIEINWENNPWKMLSIIQDKPNDLQSICILESNINRFILSKHSNQLKQLHLTPFTFHILLSRLHPLMIIFNKSLHCFNNTFNDNNNNNNNNNNVISSEKMTLNKKIELWNLGAENLSFLSHSIEEVVFNKFFENHGNYMYSEYTFNTTIHKILAIVCSDLDDKLYHFLYADELDIICHLLTSPMFICRILRDYPSTLMKFLNGYPTNDRCIQEKWKRKLESCPFGDKIDAMKKFICVNYEFLVKYPNSFCKLAINQDSSEWIHTLGLSLLYLNDFGVQSQLDMNNSQILFRVNLPKCTLIKPMQRNMIYKPIVTSNGSMDVPTSVEMNSAAKVLVYGTRCGTITFVELSTLRELWSLTGHHSSVQSLCFLEEFPSKSEDVKSPKKFISELWLMSASEDGDIFIWDASTVTHNVEYNVHDKTVISQLASLCGYHRRCVTTSAWHPRRQLVATGDLDCMVYLWDVSQIDVKSSELSTSVCSVKLHPFKSINVSSHPIVSIAFRLPSVLNNKQEDLIHDDLAIGCWDGTIHFYNLSSLSIVRSLSASTSLCSLAYSPNGGNILATFNKDGELMLWNDDILWYEGGVIQEYSCFSSEYYLFDQTDVLIPNQYGKICFSKPNGQYIFQSGGGQFLNNYINIWDTRLWATYGPWIDVKPPQIDSGNCMYVTYVAMLPSAEHVLIGWNNGDLTVIHTYDGRLIHYLKAATEDNSPIQCITSSCARSYSAFDAYHIIVGYASGAVRIFLCHLRPKISPHKGRYVYQSTNTMSELQFQLIDTLWSHSINHNVNGGVQENGGTLCVASSFCVAVTGGGNAETWVHFIGRQTGSKIKKSVCLKEHNSAVIAVSMESKFFVTASKTRQLALYKFNPLERTVTLWHLINDVGTATITSFYLLRMFIGVKTISISVYIGDSNNLLHNYAVIDKKLELKQTFHANKSPIKFMERVSNHLLAASDDGEVSAWKHDKYGVLQLSHRLNVCTDMPSKNNSNNSNVEESYYLTSFFMFYAGYNPLKFEPTLHDPTIETINKLMISNADNQYTESDDQVKDPDSEVTTLSGCNMSSSNSYVTGSDQEIYECGYKLHVDIEEESKAYSLATDYLKDEQFHLLNSCKKGYIVYRDTSYDAKYRIVYGVKFSCNKSSDSSQVIQDFCYRIFAPNILQYRGTLKGHSGFVPCALTSACTTNSDEDCIVASASGRTVCDVGCDIRLWSMPLKRKLLNYQPNQHSGPITCLGQLKITDHYSICISGCIDGSVMFWSVKNSEPLDLKNVSVADKSVQWKPLLHAFCSALRPKYAISDISTQTYVMDESKPTVHYLIYIAYGENLWRMRIILNQSNMSMNDIQNTFERLFSMNGKTELCFSELDVFWSSESDISCSDIVCFTASHPIVKISPRYAKPNHLEQCEIIAVLVNGDVIVVTSNERENFLFDHCTVQNGLWCSSIGTNDAGIFTTRSGMAFVCKHTDESRTFRRISGYMGSCVKEMWINSLSVLRTVQAEGDHFLYLAECHLINCWKILICNENGDLVTDFTLDNSSIKVTGYCAKLLSLTEDNCSTLIYLIIATSDNILHVLRCTINNPITVVNSNQWKQVAMYPVETEITQLYTLDDSQLKILAGDRQGQIHYFVLL